MKKHKCIIKFVLGIIFPLFFINCTSDDEFQGRERIPLFSEAKLSIIHGNSKKSWRITEFINIYNDPRYHLEIELSCLSDDVYTFHATNNKFSVDLGDEKCFGKNDNGVFTADEEIFDGELIFMNASQGETIYLRYTRGFSNENDTAGGISIRYFTLAELSENRMVFHRSGAEFIGEYREALIFEKVQD